MTKRLAPAGGDAAAASPHVVAPVEAPCVYSCGGAEERKRCDGDAATSCPHAVAPVGAKRSSGGALRRVARLQRIARSSVLCCGK
jgi:hypothetical protein